MVPNPDLGTCWNRLRWCSVALGQLNMLQPAPAVLALATEPVRSHHPLQAAYMVHPCSSGTRWNAWNEIGIIQISGWTVQPSILSEISWYGSKKHQHQNQVKQQKAKIWKKDENRFSFQPLNLQQKHKKKHHPISSKGTCSLQHESCVDKLDGSKHAKKKDRMSAASEDSPKRQRGSLWLENRFLPGQRI